MTKDKKYKNAKPLNDKEQQVLANLFIAWSMTVGSIHAFEASVQEIGMGADLKKWITNAVVTDQYRRNGITLVQTIPGVIAAYPTIQDLLPTAFSDWMMIEVHFRTSSQFKEEVVALVSDTQPPPFAEVMAAMDKAIELSQLMVDAGPGALASIYNAENSQSQ